MSFMMTTIISLFFILGLSFFSLEMLTLFLSLNLVILLKINQNLGSSTWLLNYLHMILDKSSSVIIVFSFFMLIPSMMSIKYMDNNYNWKLKFNLNLLMLFCLMMFLSKSIFCMYLYFEMSIIPIFLIIMGWGYQTERMSASLSLMFYTVSASMPLLMSILYLMASPNIYYISQIYMFNMLYNSSIMFMMCFMIAFLIKLPIYLGHLWLPKAHVEAPVVGSMILASVLLKLGGYGLVRLIMFMKFSKILNMSLSIALTGSFIIGFMCLHQMDLKVIIAYSSIAHMGLMVSSLLCLSNSGLIGGLMLMVSHGFSSSSMFFGGNLFYLRSSSRSVILSKGMLLGLPLMSFLWLLSMMTSMAAPPMINLLAEIISVMTIATNCYLSLSMLIFIIFLAGAYSLLLYSATQHSNLINSSLKLQTSQLLEVLIFLFHMLWSVLLMLAIPLFM